MSGTRNPGGEVEEEDAALVDSFFLPGGILDPDDDEDDEDEVPGIHPAFANSKEVSRVPSNPWSNDHHDSNSCDDANNGAKETAKPSSPQHDDDGCNSALRAKITPPPGYTEKDRLKTNGNGFFNSGTEDNNGHVEPNTLNESCPVKSFQSGLGRDNYVSSPDSRFENKTIQRPNHPIDTGQADTSWDDHAGNLLPSQSEDSAELTADELEQTLFGEFTSSNLSSPLTTESKRSRNTSASEDNSITSSDDDDNDNDDDDDDDNDDDDESGSLRSNSSIPLELLSVCGIYTGDSLTSSLSSSSGDSDGSGRILNPVERTGEEEEEENYELPQEVHIIEDNPDQDLTETASTHDTSGAVVCTASSSSESTDSQWAHADRFRYLLQKIWLALSAWSLSVLEFPKSAVRSIQQTFIFKYLTRVARKLSLQTTRLVNAFQIFSQYLGDAKDIAAALTAQLLTTIRVLLATITKALILIAAFLFQVWKYSLIQAVEDPNVTICYLVFYFMPDFCSLMMDLLNIPHWTPHLMTSLAVFLLCNQIKPGPLFTQDVSILQLTETRDKGAKDSYSHVSSKSEAPKDHINRRDERACKTILKILRFVLPIFFLADGFSIEFGTILGVSGASRLTTAFMMSLVRKNLVSSPVGWVSWAVQVLVATHYPSWKLLDHVVLVVGLSSIRLIRYLEGERFKEKKRN